MEAGAEDYPPDKEPAAAGNEQPGCQNRVRAEHRPHPRRGLAGCVGAQVLYLDYNQSRRTAHRLLPLDVSGRQRRRTLWFDS
jgi:hypothetical protein